MHKIHLVDNFIDNLRVVLLLDVNYTTIIILHKLDFLAIYCSGPGANDRLT